MDAIHFGHLGSTRVSVKSNIVWLSVMQKDIKKIQHLYDEYEFRWDFQITITVDWKDLCTDFDETRERKTNRFSRKLLYKNITNEPCLLVGLYRCRKWSVKRIYRSTEAKEVIKFLESFFNLHGVVKIVKSVREGAYISQENQSFWKTKNIETDCRPSRILPVQIGWTNRFLKTWSTLV